MSLKLLTEPDVLGVALVDWSNALEDPPSMIVYGRAGLGKTLQVQQCFAGTVGGPGALSILSNKGTIRSYIDWCAKNREQVEDLNLRTATMPNPDFDFKKPHDSMTNPAYLQQARPWAEGGIAAKVIPEFEYDRSTGETTRVSNRVLIRAICNRLTEYRADCRERGEQPEYNGIIIDDGTEFAKRIKKEVQADSTVKNGWAKMDAIEEFLTWVFQVPRTADCLLVYICHDSDPKFYPDEHPKAGKLQHHGGPELPTGRQRKDLSGLADVVLHGVLQKKGGSAGLGSGKTKYERAWITQIEPEWCGKIRAWGIESTTTKPIRDVLIESGYRLW